MRTAACWLTDACCVLAFVVIGRSAHHHGESLAGIGSTAWPFLAGLAAGLLAARAWRRPAAIIPAGIGAWLGSAAIGMLLRVAAGQGTALPFIGVALAFLGASLLGWRALARLSRWPAPYKPRRSARPSPAHDTFDREAP